MTANAAAGNPACGSAPCGRSAARRMQQPQQPQQPQPPVRGAARVRPRYSGRRLPQFQRMRPPPVSVAACAAARPASRLTRWAAAPRAQDLHARAQRDALRHVAGGAAAAGGEAARVAASSTSRPRRRRRRRGTSADGAQPADRRGRARLRAAQLVGATARRAVRGRDGTVQADLRKGPDSAADSSAAWEAAAAARQAAQKSRADMPACGGGGGYGGGGGGGGGGGKGRWGPKARAGSMMEAWCSDGNGRVDSVCVWAAGCQFSPPAPYDTRP